MFLCDFIFRTNYGMFPFKVVFSDEATFHLSGNVDWQAEHLGELECSYSN